MPKTLAIVVTTDLTSDQRVQRAAEALAQDGWQVTVLGRVLPTSLDLLPSVYAQFRLSCPFVAGPLFYLYFNLQLFFWLLSHRPSVLTACDADTLLGCTLAAGLLGIPLVFDAHEYFSEVPEVVRRPAVQRIWRGIENLCIPHVAVAYTVSQSLADLFTTLYKKPFGLVRNVPKKKVTLPHSPIPKRIVYTGAINEGRGLEELLCALPLLPGYSVVVCGQGPLLPFLEKCAREIGVGDRVRFTGQLSPDTLQSELAHAWLGYGLLQPNGLSYQYSLANKFFDYIQAGVPQLCPNLPEYEAILRQHPVCVASACSQEEIVKAILQMADAHFYQTCQAACQQAAKVFSWEEEKKTLLALYKPLKG